MTESRIHILRSNAEEDAEPRFETFTVPHDQDMTLMYVGHGLAGGLAAAGITSLVLYMLSDRLDDPIPGAVGFGPAPGGGAVLSGGIRF